MEEAAAGEGEDGGGDEGEDGPARYLMGVGGVVEGRFDVAEGLGVDFVLEVVEFELEAFDVVGVEVVDLALEGVEDGGDELLLELDLEFFKLADLVEEGGFKGVLHGEDVFIDFFFPFFHTAGKLVILGNNILSQLVELPLRENREFLHLDHHAHLVQRRRVRLDACAQALLALAELLHDAARTHE